MVVPSYPRKNFFLLREIVEKNRDARGLFFLHADHLLPDVPKSENFLPP